MKTKIYSKENDKEILSIYLKEINKFSLLTREEEVKYAKLAKTGDKNAREKLVNSNLKFVINIAKKYKNQGLPFMDLISEGNLGLLNAINKFDVERGYHFISYAVWWIRQSIMKAIYEKSRIIRLPSNRANDLIHIERMRKQLQKQYSDKDEIEKISEELNLSKEIVRNLISLSKEHISLESTISEDKNSSSHADFLKDDKVENDPEYMSTMSVLRDDIDKILSEVLSEREKDVLKSRFGLKENNEDSLKEIGERHNLSKERIRQIEKKAIKKLINSKSKDKLKPYLV